MLLSTLTHTHLLKVRQEGGGRERETGRTTNMRGERDRDDGEDRPRQR